MTHDPFDRSEDEAQEEAALSRAARALHEEWDSPHLWPRISAALRREGATSAAPRRRWYAPASPSWRLAMAASALLTIGTTTWVVWRGVAPQPQPKTTAAVDERLLTDEAVAAIEKSEAQYVRAIEELTRLTRPKLEMPDSPLIVNLRERLMTIDAAIDEYRKEIDRNRFNAHLRQQLLWIYQEKRRTLEQVQESTHAS
jgi:hypothetical protein